MSDLGEPSGDAPAEAAAALPADVTDAHIPAMLGEGDATLTDDDTPRRAARPRPFTRLVNGALAPRDAVVGRFGPRALVGLSVLFGLYALRAERLPTPYPNDAAVHSLTVAFATSQIANGHFPLDGWFPFLSSGSPFFIHYQSFSAVLTGLLGNVIGAHQAFSWTGYLLLSFWPVSVYIGARLFDLDRWSSACAAAAMPVITNGGVGYGFEHEAYVFYGSGLWSQLWGMVLLPIALGLGWRAISRRQHLVLAGVVLGWVIIFHFLTAYLAGLAVFVFAFLRPFDLVRRVKRLVVVGVLALLTACWVLVPLIATANYAATNEFEEHTYFDDSYGAKQVLSWLFHGQIFDAGRFPVVSIFLAIGFVVCVVRIRRDERARALLSVFVLSLLLYFGRVTFGAAVNILPDNSDLLFHRYVMGVQLFGVIFAGIGLASTARGAVWLIRRIPRWSLPDERAATWRIVAPIVAIVLVVGILEPGWRQVADYDAFSGTSIHNQRLSDATDGADVNALVARAESEGGGRIFAGLPSEPDQWAFDFRVGSVPVYIYLADEGADAIGFTLRTTSLTTDPEAYFNEYVPADYELFGIHYLIYPSNRQPGVPATLLEQRGTYDLYSVGSFGYVHIIDTSGVITANSTDLGAATKTYLETGLADKGIFDVMSYPGLPKAVPTASAAHLPTTSPGTVLAESDDLDQGEATTTVKLSRTAVVMLAASYDPGWQVTVDGRAATTEMVAPAMVAVTVGPGTHTIAFRYQAFPYYPELIAISVLTAGVGFVYERRRRASLAGGTTVSEPVDEPCSA